MASPKSKNGRKASSRSAPSQPKKVFQSKLRNQKSLRHDGDLPRDTDVDISDDVDVLAQRRSQKEVRESDSEYPDYASDDDDFTASFDGVDKDVPTFGGLMSGVGNLKNVFNCSHESQRIADVVVAVTYVIVYLFPGSAALLLQALMTFLSWFGLAGQAAGLVVSTGAAAVKLWGNTSSQFLKSAALTLTSTALQSKASTTTWVGYIFGQIGVSESGEVDFVKLVNTIQKIPGFIIARNSVCVVIENALPEETRRNWSSKVQNFSRIQSWMDALFKKKKLWEITAVGSDADRNEKQMALLKTLAEKATSEFALKEAMKNIENVYAKK